MLLTKHESETFGTDLLDAPETRLNLASVPLISFFQTIRSRYTKRIFQSLHRHR
jgi:hypothetical protein